MQDSEIILKLLLVMAHVQVMLSSSELPFCKVQNTKLCIKTHGIDSSVPCEIDCGGQEKMKNTHLLKAPKPPHYMCGLGGKEYRPCPYKRLIKEIHAIILMDNVVHPVNDSETFSHQYVQCKRGLDTCTDTSVTGDRSYCNKNKCTNSTCYCSVIEETRLNIDNMKVPIHLYYVWLEYFIQDNGPSEFDVVCDPPYIQIQSKKGCSGSISVGNAVIKIHNTTGKFQRTLDELVPYAKIESHLSCGGNKVVKHITHCLDTTCSSLCWFCLDRIRSVSCFDMRSASIMVFIVFFLMALSSLIITCSTFVNGMKVLLKLVRMIIITMPVLIFHRIKNMWATAGSGQMGCSPFIILIFCISSAKIKFIILLLILLSDAYAENQYISYRPATKELCTTNGCTTADRTSVRVMPGMTEITFTYVEHGLTRVERVDNIRVVDRCLSYETYLTTPVRTSVKSMHKCPGTENCESYVENDYRIPSEYGKDSIKNGVLPGNACGSCFYCTRACLFYSVSLKPTAESTMVYRCVHWDLGLKYHHGSSDNKTQLVNIELSQRRQLDIKHRSSCIYHVRNIAYEGSCNEKNSLIVGRVGEIQCDNTTCIANPNIIEMSGAYNAKAHLNIIDPTLMTEKMLPVEYPTGILTQDREDIYFEMIISNAFDITVFSPDIPSSKIDGGEIGSCDVKDSVIMGCYDCTMGAKVVLSIEGTGLLDVTCDDFKILSYIEKPFVKIYVDKENIDTKCIGRCGVMDVNFGIKGTLQSTSLRSSIRQVFETSPIASSKWGMSFSLDLLNSYTSRILFIGFIAASATIIMYLMILKIKTRASKPDNLLPFVVETVKDARTYVTRQSRQKDPYRKKVT